MAQQTLNVTFSITIANALAFTPANLPQGIVGQVYPATPVGTVTGGASPYSWTATGLPAGMTLSAVGVLSGTPTAAGNFTPAATIADSST
jgi:hypothetical protein